nr:unnamed protein product [Digitaria exilis]
MEGPTRPAQPHTALSAESGRVHGTPLTTQRRPGSRDRPRQHLLACCPRRPSTTLEEPETSNYGSAKTGQPSFCPITGSIPPRAAPNLHAKGHCYLKHLQ